MFPIHNSLWTPAILKSGPIFSKESISYFWLCLPWSQFEKRGYSICTSLNFSCPCNVPGVRSVESHPCRQNSILTLVLEPFLPIRSSKLLNECLLISWMLSFKAMEKSARAHKCPHLSSHCWGKVRHQHVNKVLHLPSCHQSLKVPSVCIWNLASTY